MKINESAEDKPNMLSSCQLVYRYARIRVPLIDFIKNIKQLQTIWIHDHRHSNPQLRPKTPVPLAFAPAPFESLIMLENMGLKQNILEAFSNNKNGVSCKISLTPILRNKISRSANGFLFGGHMYSSCNTTSLLLHCISRLNWNLSTRLNAGSTSGQCPPVLPQCFSEPHTWSKLGPALVTKGSSQSDESLSA